MTSLSLLAAVTALGVDLQIEKKVVIPGHEEVPCSLGKYFSGAEVKETKDALSETQLLLENRSVFCSEYWSEMH